MSAVLTDQAEAAVVRPFTLNYNQEVYGDFLELGNGNSVCPGLTAPTDPFGEPKATCLLAQARTYTAAAGINDSYYMQWADVDANAATFNSSTGTVTVPPGARVDFARLNWSGDTGTIRLADGTVSALPGCNTRQFLAGGGTAVLPAGTPESTSVRLAVGAGASTAVAPQVISRDALANVPASQPQFYAAHADVTAQLQAAATGLPTTITVGNVWTPQGFGCYSGWSLVVVYAYDEPNPLFAPGKREIFLYDGHVRQSSVDPTTTVTVTGFRVAGTPVRVGLTGYEGDFNIAGDQFSVDGVPVADPLGGSTSNFWVADAENRLLPAPANNMSVDAKDFDSAIPLGATSAQLSFSTAGDTYLAQNLVLSVPVPSLSITKSVVGGPFRPGQPIPFVIEVVSPGGIQTVGVSIDDPLFADCDRDLGTLLPDVPVTYTCTGPAPGADGVNTAIVTGQDAFGDPLTDSDDAAFEVINPAVDITKTADRESYAPGEVVTFTITVTNTGDAPLTAVTVVDPKVPTCGSVTPLLAPGGSFTYTCTTLAPVPGDENTATVTGLDPLLGIVTDTASAPAPTLGSVSGQVFADRNDNGLLDVADGDTGIGGVPVTLTGTTAGGLPVSLLTTTAPDGTYTFVGLPAGTYTVTETQPVAFDDGQDTPGNSAVGAGNDAFTVTMGQGTTSSGNNFAELPTSGLAGAVYEDSNGNGVLDDGEPDLAGVTVTLTGVDSAGNPVTLTTTTAADGTYTFPSLRDGLYTITETQPAGYLDGADTVGSVGGLPVPPDSITAIPLLPRTDGTGYDFGETVAASISGRVVNDAGTGIGGVAVTLTGPLALPVTVFTAPDGTYSFPGLLPGTYTVTETQPVGYGDGTDTLGSVGGDNSVDDVFSGIVIRSGVDAVDYVFAETRGSLAGSVYEDVNGNGLRDGGELGIPGTTVTLTGIDAAGSPVNLTTTTAGDGSYLFDNLLAGLYSVTETQPAGYLDGIDAAGTSGGVPVPPDAITAIALTPGTDATGYLYGETVAASISGRVVDDAGTGMGGVTVTLTSGPLTVTVLTAPDGTYTFPGLPPGTYTVTETQPVGYGDGTDTVGSAGGTNSANDVISGIVIASGTTATGYDFAETRGSLAGSVYSDLDGDGTRDAGEPGIADVAVALTGTDLLGNPVSLSTTTAADGTYSFIDLLAGTYVVTETQPAGYLDGSDTAGSAGGTPVPPDSVTGIELAGGIDADGYLFGEVVASSLTGSVVDDGGNPIPGVTVTLTGTDDLGNPVSLTTTSGADGTWSFEGLRPGTYTVTETQPAGYGDGPETVGSAGGTASANDVISGIVLVPGTDADGYRFAETRGSLAGSVYEDRDNDGVRDAGEAGIGGVTVTLTGTDALGRPASLSTTTAADGAYTFADVVGGVYTLVETQPAAYADGIDTAGTAGGTPVAPDTITGIELGGGADATGYLFGELAGALTGTVYLDADGDGVIDADETTRLAGVVVVLLDGEGNEITRTTTGTDGGYAFPGLPAGEYTVQQEQPPGYGSTTPNLVDVTVSPGGGGTVDFGERLGTIGDLVWSDTNGNAVRDPGEPGVAGVVVLLLSGGTEIDRTTTDADGAYVFTDLPPGTYTVHIELPDGLTLVAPNVGGDDALDSDFDQVTLSSAPVMVEIVDGLISQVDTVDAGLVDAVVDLTITLTTDRPTATVGDVVTFTATAGNAGTVPVAGSTVTVTVPAGLRIDSATGDGWACTTSGQVATCTTDDVLLPGRSAPPVRVVTTALTTLATTTAVAQVFPPAGVVEDDPNNNSATAPVTVVAAPVTPTPPPPQPRPPLPATGVQLAGLTGGGLLLLTIGSIALLAVARRRED